MRVKSRATTAAPDATARQWEHRSRRVACECGSEEQARTEPPLPPERTLCAALLRTCGGAR